MQLKFPESYIAVDIETNGFSPAHNEIIEIAAIRVSYGKEVGRFNQLIKARVTPKIEAITGITQQMLDTQGISLKSALTHFIAFLPPINLPLVGHNIFNFDYKFLRWAFDTELFNSNILDTQNIVDTAVIYKALKMDEKQRWNETHIDLEARIMHLRPIKGQKWNLEEACKEFDIKIGTRHRALADAELTSLLYQRMCLNEALGKSDRAIALGDMVYQRDLKY